MIVGGVAGVAFYNNNTKPKDKLSTPKGKTKCNIIYRFITILKETNFKVIFKILMTWVITIPINAILQIFTFLLFTFIVAIF